jgi:tRNA(Ile)-lysidine synthetase-like protein
VVRDALRSAGVQGDGIKADRVVLAVSGGGDSMAMLALVAALRARTAGGLSRMAVVSIDHGLREEARVEAEAAVTFARALGVGRAEVRRVDVPRSGNLLDAARAARLTALRAACDDFGAKTLLVAHQAEDRAESLLIGLSRGIGVEALAALMPARAFDDGITVVRPMLGCRRADLHGFLRELGVPWFEDPSNAMRDRGALRGDPAASALVKRIVAGCGTLFAEVEGLLALRDGLAMGTIGASGARTIDRAAVESIHPVVRAEVLARLGHAAGTVVRRSVIAQAEIVLAGRDRAPHRYALEGGWVLVLDRARVAVEPAHSEPGIASDHC